MGTEAPPAKQKLHVPPEKDWKFKRQRNDDEHVKNCKDGYIQPTGKTPHVLEIHHILCVHACSDETFPDDITPEDKDFIHVCLANTEWNINSGHNNIGLPQKQAYVQDPINATNWNNLPCHQVDHNPRYRVAVEDWMTKNVWRKMLGAQEAKKCEYLQGKNVAKLFNMGVGVWKNFLKTRGKTNGGVKASFDYCFEGIAGPGVNEDTWFIPFSMDPSPVVRKRIKPKKKGEKLHIDALLKLID